MILLLVIKELHRQSDINFDSVEKISDIAFLMVPLQNLLMQNLSALTISCNSSKYDEEERKRHMTTQENEANFFEVSIAFCVNFCHYSCFSTKRSNKRYIIFIVKDFQCWKNE